MAFFHLSLPALTLILATSSSSQLWIGANTSASNQHTPHYKKINIIRSILIALTILGIASSVEPLKAVALFVRDGGRVEEITGEIVEQRAPVFGAFFLHRYLVLDENSKTWSFYFPNQVRSTGQKYEFTILPSTSFVLDSRPID